MLTFLIHPSLHIVFTFKISFPALLPVARIFLSSIYNFIFLFFFFFSPLLLSVQLSHFPLHIYSYGTLYSQWLNAAHLHVGFRNDGIKSSPIYSLLYSSSPIAPPSPIRVSCPVTSALTSFSTSYTNRYVYRYIHIYIDIILAESKLFLIRLAPSDIW